MDFIDNVHFVSSGSWAVADAFYQKHAYFSAENWFGFYALYGFFMCVGLVLAAKVMRILLMRGEDYYDKEGDND